ncbi:hypothetical protein M405DRAFT_744189, partial [Rhizopogon salebrosus TDB-379]
KDAGTIMLKVKRVKLQGSKPANQLQRLPDWTSQGHVGEHCVGYGQERVGYVQSPTTWKVEPYDESSKRSYVTFVFRYRSRGASKVLMNIRCNNNRFRLAHGARNYIRWRWDCSACKKTSSSEATSRQCTCCTANNTKPDSDSRSRET